MAHVVWMKARHNFTFAGRAYTTGEVFPVAPLVAVQLRARRSVEFAKQPPAEAPQEAAAPPPRRRGRPPGSIKPVPAVVATEPEPPAVEAVPIESPTPETIPDRDLTAGTYARKDLRAED